MEVEAGASGARGHPWLPKKYMASLGHETLSQRGGLGDRSPRALVCSQFLNISIICDHTEGQDQLTKTKKIVIIIPNNGHRLQKEPGLGARESSVANSSGCSSKWLGFDSQHLHSSQQSLTTVSGYQYPLLTSPGTVCHGERVCMCVCART